MRLTARTLSQWRTTTLSLQGGTCAVCGRPITITDPAVADHSHRTGQCRGVLHRSCNALLGKIENNHVRYGLKDTIHLARFLGGVAGYLNKRIPEDAPLYPTHRTDDEKRELRNKRARLKRAAAKKEPNDSHLPPE